MSKIKFRVWDSINKNKRVFVIGDVLTDEDVDVLNDASIKNKGDVLCFFIVHFSLRLFLIVKQLETNSVGHQ